MKVIHWIYGLQGGAGYIAISLSEELKQDLIYFDISGPSYWGTEKRSRDLSKKNNNIFRLRNWSEFKNFASQEKPKAIVYHLWRADNNTPPFKIEGCLNIAYVHTSSLPNLKEYDFYILVSESQYQSVPLRPCSNVELIKNGIEISEFINCYPDFRSFNLLRFSSLSYEKISPMYKDIFQYYKDSNVKFTFLGGGEGQELLKRYVNETGNNNVFLIGDSNLDQIKKYINLSCAILYLNGNHVENHSISIIEAMVAGLPVICENKGGLPNQVIDGKTGFLCNSVNDVLRSINLLRDYNTCVRMSNNARRIGKTFTIQRTISEFTKSLKEWVKLKS